LNVKRLTLALLLLAAPVALAHDFWIEPSTFRPAAGQIVSARLRVGQKMQGDPVPRVPPYIERFFAKGNAGENPMIGQPGSEPAGLMRVNEPGLHWIGYQSTPTPLTQDAQKFENYLRDEGLDSIIEKRAKSGQTNVEGRERFYRCAKSLLATGDASTGFETPLGFTLELVPHANPYALRAGGELPLTILFRGKPLSNVLIVAMSKDDPEHTVRARSDKRGRASLQLPRGGFWLVKAVHMEPAPKSSGSDWESWWASMTFELAK
jgi:uncharacterized GH25 family protein